MLFIDAIDQGSTVNPKLSGLTWWNIDPVSKKSV